MSGTLVTRVVVGALGVVVGLYGGWLLVSRQDSRQIWGAARWLVGGVVAHDALISVAVLVGGLLVTRVVPRVARVPVTVGAIVLGSGTLLAIPVLLSYGRKDDNPSLLDRDYAAGWWVFASVVVVSVVAWSVVATLRNRRS